MQVVVSKQKKEIVDSKAH